MDRRHFLASALASTLTGQTQRAPNLVLILADDLGYGDIGCYGSPDVATPNLDSIAKNGVRFTDGYVSCAVCSPSRAALLTGRYQNRYGHEFNPGPTSPPNFGLPKTERTLPEYLKAAGYRTGAIGKWHLGEREGFHPLDRGFDEYFGFLAGGNDFVTTKTHGAVATGARIPESRRDPILRGRKVVQEERYLTDVFGEEAVAFIRRNRAAPFLLYLAFNAVHTPLHATQKYVDRFAGIKNERHRLLAAMTAAMDEAVGGVLGELRRQNLENDTLVVFLSDNGCPTITGAGTNYPLNGEKCTYYEGGIRVPFLVQWRGRIRPGQTFGHPVVSRDILPTFLAAAGVTPPAKTEFDGVNLLPYLQGQREGSPHQALFWRAGKIKAVREGTWKLIEYGRGPRLYDLKADIGEKKDLADSNPAVVKRLQAAHAEWESRMSKPLWPVRRRQTVVNGEKITWEL